MRATTISETIAVGLDEDDPRQALCDAVSECTNLLGAELIRNAETAILVVLAARGGVKDKQQNRAVLGSFSPGRRSVVLFLDSLSANGDSLARVLLRTLSHELVHADQYSRATVPRDGVTGSAALAGDAYVSDSLECEAREKARAIEAAVFATPATATSALGSLGLRLRTLGQAIDRVAETCELSENPADECGSAGGNWELDRLEQKLYARFATFCLGEQSNAIGYLTDPLRKAVSMRLESVAGQLLGEAIPDLPPSVHLWNLPLASRRELESRFDASMAEASRDLLDDIEAQDIERLTPRFERMRDVRVARELIEFLSDVAAEYPAVSAARRALLHVFL